LPLARGVAGSGGVERRRIRAGPWTPRSALSDGLGLRRCTDQAGNGERKPYRGREGRLDTRRRHTQETRRVRKCQGRTAEDEPGTSRSAERDKHRGVEPSRRHAPEYRGRGDEEQDLHDASVTALECPHPPRGQPGGAAVRPGAPAGDDDSSRTRSARCASAQDVRTRPGLCTRRPAADSSLVTRTDR
jgi:hypothetical protein